MNQTHLDTARLLTQIAPFVFAEGTSAPKGGTAINFRVQQLRQLRIRLPEVTCSPCCLTWVGHRAVRREKRSHCRP